MLTYKPVKEEDIKELIPLMFSFIEESMYKEIPIDSYSIYITLDNFRKNDEACFYVCLDSDKPIGCIVGTHSPLPFNMNIIQASETLWFVSPEYRHQNVGQTLYKMFIDWAECLGARVIHTASPYGSNLGTAYEKDGYKMFEELYIKVI